LPIEPTGSVTHLELVSAAASPRSTRAGPSAASKPAARYGRGRSGRPAPSRPVAVPTAPRPREPALQQPPDPADQRGQRADAFRILYLERAALFRFAAGFAACLVPTPHWLTPSGARPRPARTRSGAPPERSPARARGERPIPVAGRERPPLREQAENATRPGRETHGNAPTSPAALPHVGPHRPRGGRCPAPVPVPMPRGRRPRAARQRRIAGRIGKGQLPLALHVESPPEGSRYPPLRVGRETGGRRIAQRLRNAVDGDDDSVPMRLLKAALVVRLPPCLEPDESLCLEQLEDLPAGASESEQ
jgi:hypothetical protein